VSLISCASPSCVLSSLVTAISKQSCWPPARRQTLTWHFHSQIICLLLKIYAIACSRNGPEPEHLRLPLQSSDLQPGPAADTTGFIFGPEPQRVRLSGPAGLPALAVALSRDLRAWRGRAHASTLLSRLWLLIHIPVDDTEGTILVCAVVRQGPLFGHRTKHKHSDIDRLPIPKLLCFPVIVDGQGTPAILWLFAKYPLISSLYTKHPSQ